MKPEIITRAYPVQVADIKLESSQMMDVPLIASVCLALNVVLLWSIVLSITDVVRCREDIVIEILASIVAFLVDKQSILQLRPGYDAKSKIFIDYFV